VHRPHDVRDQGEHPRRFSPAQPPPFSPLLGHQAARDGSVRATRDSVLHQWAQGAWRAIATRDKRGDADDDSACSSTRIAADDGEQPFTGVRTRPGVHLGDNAAAPSQRAAKGRMMYQRSRAVIWLLAVVCVSAYALAGISVTAQHPQPDFTGVWTTYNEPGAAPAGRGGGPPLPLMEGRELSGAREADRRYPRRVLPGDGDAWFDARLRRLPDGDPSAAGTDHHRLRGA
jgi:hypothetical protein